MDSSGKTAPSFIATVVVLVLAVVGYFAWGILSPNPIARSAMVVRDFSTAAANELGSLRRVLREEMDRYKKDPGTVGSVRAAIDEHADEARDDIGRLADDAADQIALIEGIGLRTQDNRLQRIKKRTTEVEQRIDDLVAEMRGKLPPDGP